MKTYTLKINNLSHTIEADAEMPLLWAIRDIIGLKGTKYGCGQGLCGACTVHVDGSAVRSCSMFVSDVEGLEVTTIEGLGGEVADKLRQAWLDQQVPQCGYCQGGQLLSAAALLNENTAPAEDEIDDAMSGNLCRCGTYDRIKKAIKQASAS